jgi:hypothetical protein
LKTDTLKILKGVPADLKVGEQIKFFPRGSDIAGWWTVRARDDRWIIATAQAPFRKKGELVYTVVDLTGWQNHRRNGAGMGVVRNRLDIIGGGWGDGTFSDTEIAEMLAALQDPESPWELSVRGVVNVWDVEVRGGTDTT